MSTLNDILTAAQSLPSAERAHLVHALWDTLPPEAWAPPSSEWVAEAQSRSEGLDAGQITVAPWSEVRARARRQAGLDG